MIRFITIAGNTFVQTIRQPIVGVLILVTLGVLVLSVPLAGWTMSTSGEFTKVDQQMLVSLGLSTLLVSGLLIAAFSASAVVAREIDDKTALTVLSKPVARATFVTGKFAGVACAVAVAFYICAIWYLMTVRHKVMSSAADPYDIPVIVFGCSALAAAIVIATLGNLLFRWSFSSAAIWTAVVTFTLAMGIISIVGKNWEAVPPGYDLPPRPVPERLVMDVDPAADYPTVRKEITSRQFEVEEYDQKRHVVTVIPPTELRPYEAVNKLKDLPGASNPREKIDPPLISVSLLAAIILIFMAVMVFVAVAVAVSTRLGQVMTLLICCGVFVVGSAHPTLFGKAAEGNFVIQGLGWLVPKLNYFDPQYAMSMGYPIPWQFLATAGAYCACYVVAVLALGGFLFHGRQLDSEGTAAAMPPLVGVMAWAGRIFAAAMAIIALVILGRISDYSVSTLLRAGGLIVVAAAGWLFWGYFGRGVKWAYRLAVALLALAALRLILGVTFDSVGEFLQVGVGTVQIVAHVLTIAIVAIILFLPSTRRHFNQ